MCVTNNVNTFLDSITRPRVKRVVPIDGVEEFQGATLQTDLNLGMLDDGENLYCTPVSFHIYMLCMYGLKICPSFSSMADETRHRYPWICSVRSREVSPQHYCAVTLFSRPPAPTVLVGPAHCTYLCKSSLDEVDNCCCGGQNDCSEDIPRCGNTPKVVEMTGKVLLNILNNQI